MATHEELLERDDVKALVAECKAKTAPNKRLRPIDTTAGVMILQSPSRAQWNVFMLQMFDDEKGVQARATESLVRSLCVHPDATTLAQWLEEYPGMLTDPDVVKEVRRLAGSAKEANAK